jgi:hypothetical protein
MLDKIKQSLLSFTELTRYETSSGDTPQVAPHVTPHVTPQVDPAIPSNISPQVQLLLNTLTGEMQRDALQLACKLKDRKSFSQRYLKPALAAGLIEMTILDKPRSRLQRYRLTALGQKVKSD